MFQVEVSVAYTAITTSYVMGAIRSASAAGTYSYMLHIDAVGVWDHFDPLSSHNCNRYKCTDTLLSLILLYGVRGPSQ